MPRISVCMASHNGGRYISEQIRSILPQLATNDEVIISDDGSTDDTFDVIRSFDDPRIKLVLCNQLNNHVYNFENALKCATGDLIFLADQDDIWLENKVAVMTDILERFDLVVSDCSIVNEHKEVISDSYFAYRKSGPGLLTNIMRNTYLGCCMAFNRNVLANSLPFPPKYIHSHDWWIGVVAEAFGKICFHPGKLLLYRRHDNNHSPVRGVSYRNKIFFRITLMIELARRFRMANTRIKNYRVFN